MRSDALRVSVMWNLAVLLVLEVGGAAWIAFETFQLAYNDEKWGDEWGNFYFGLFILQLFVAGAIAGNLAAIAVQRRTARSLRSRSALGLGAVTALVLVVLLATGVAKEMSGAIGGGVPKRVLMGAVVPGFCTAIVMLFVVGRRQIGSLSDAA